MEQRWLLLHEAAVASLHLAALPLLVVSPLGWQLRPGGVVEGDTVQPDALCHTVATFSHLMLGLLVPLLWQIHCWRPGPSLLELEAPGATTNEATASSLTARAARAEARIVAVCDRLLYGLAGGGQSLAVRCLIAWYVAATMWLLCQPGPGQSALRMPSWR